MKSIDHNKIVSEGLIEKYLMQQLSGEEETAFEEHLLFCSECRKELHRQEKIITAIDDTIYRRNFGDKHPGMTETPKKDNLMLILVRSRFVRIAASIVFLLGLCGLVYFLSIQQSEKKGIADETKTGKENQQNRILSDSLPATQTPVKRPEKNYADDHRMDFFAENYTPHPLYEQMVDNLVRSGNLKMIEPVDSVIVNAGDKIQFAWQFNRDEEFELVVLTNKGEIVNEMKVRSPFELKDLGELGLYYWKLDTHEETVAAGKIYVIEKINHQ